MASQNDKDRLDQALDTIDASRRDSMRKLLVGAAFIPPVVSSFAIYGMSVSAAHADIGNSSSSNLIY